MSMKKEKISLMLAIFLLILGSKVFAAEGDIYLKNDGTPRYIANQINVSLQARNDVRVNNNLYQIEVGGKKFDLVTASIAYAKDSLKWKELLINGGVDNVKNHDITSARKIETGKPLELFIESGLSNYYSVEVKDSGRLEIEVNRYDDNNINLHFSIMDSNNQEKELIRNGSKIIAWGGNTSPDRIIIVDVEPGLYYIKTNTDHRKDHVNVKGESGKYRLLVNYKKSNISDDEEESNNDNIYKAIPIELDSSNTGHIMYMRKDGARDETDYFRFEVLESGKVDISLRRYDYNNVNLYLCILDKMKKEVVLYSKESTITNNNTSSNKAMILDLEPGQYYIKLTTPFIYDYNHYEGYSGEYKLSVDYSKPTIKEDIEINDEISQALQIDLNSINYGHIMYTRNNGERDKIDTYKFSVLQRSSVDINIKGYNMSNINLYLTKLNDMNKEVVIYADYYNTNLNTGVISNERTIKDTLEPGEYFIRIDTPYIYKDLYYQGDSGEYTLTINLN